MKPVYVVLFSSLFMYAQAAQVPLAVAAAIGNEIWQKECKRSYEQLTWWKKGEQWASMGIGHFIWYPAGTHGRYTESFPAVLSYLHNHGVALPAWLYNKTPQPCPWASEAAFMHDFHSARMLELRALLKNTITLQAHYIIEHFNSALTTMLDSLGPKEKRHVQEQLNRLFTHARGVYALIDYANFKGMGTNPQENYQGHRWGLLQVLTNMHRKSTGISAVQEFATAAQDILTQRVRYSPADSKEKQWLAGWHNRITTYTSQI